MKADIRTILQMLRDGAAVRGAEGGAQWRRTVEYWEEFDTLIPVSDVDDATQLPIPVPLPSADPINHGDVLLLMPERPLKFYFENIQVEPDPGPFEPPGGGILVGAGGLLLIVGGDLQSDPLITGVVLVQNTEDEPVRLRGALGGTVDTAE